jgi:hypothetical protein
MSPEDIRELFLINIETEHIVLTERLELIRYKGLKRALKEEDVEKIRILAELTRMRIAFEKNIFI